MIPIRLALSNFMSYGSGSPAVEFGALQVACLSGDNGNGKSALLDGITWALWGQARAHADSLVRHGASAMVVDLEFEMDERRYRVIRQRSLARTNSTHTELQTLSPDGQYRSLTGQGERETQEKITRLLRMDYRSFINSAFILQGRADEFTRQGATDRKKILADILSLDRYDELETAARERQRLSEDRGKVLQGEVEGLLREITRRPDYEQALAESRNTLTSLQQELAGREAKLAELREQAAAIAIQAALLDSLADQERRSRQAEEEARRRAQGHDKRLKELDAVLQQRTAIEARLAQWNEARRALEGMEEAQKQFLEAESQIHRLETEIASLRHKIELKLTEARRHRDDLLRRASQGAPIRQNIQKLRTEHRSAADLEAELDALRHRKDEHEKQGQFAIAGLQHLETQQAGLDRRKEMLARPSAACPVCANPLTPHDHHRLLSDLEGEQKKLREDKARLQSEKKEAEEQVQNVMAEGRKLRKQIDAARTAEQQLAVLERDLATAAAAEEELPTAESALVSIEQELRRDLDSSARLKEAQQARHASGYNADRHQELRLEVKRLESAQRDHQNLEHAAAMRDDVAGQAAESRDLARAHAETAAKLAEQIAPLASIPTRKAELDRGLKESEELKQELVRRAESTREELGRASTLLERCDLLEKDRIEKQEEMAGASTDAALYRELALAFGKKGIQAMIIENAIPELEEEANRLLSQLTDNGMRVQFHTQKELKRGGGAETLDIIIGDELGDRPYECYSGGEAFRINFAIRMALSRLLAHRAGARLQTVVIDEGFGSQDSHGRKRLVEAIQAIKDEFALILVITHLDDMKDEFPSRLHVTKDENGSRVMLQT